MAGAGSSPPGGERRPSPDAPEHSDADPSEDLVADVSEHPAADVSEHPAADVSEHPDAEHVAAPPAAPPASSPTWLDDRSRAILAFERRWWRHAGAKEQAIRDTFEVPVTRYYQLLNTLLDDPAAAAHDPVLVARLRRLRQRRPGRDE